MSRVMPLLPSEHLIEYYATYYTEEDFLDFLRRRNVAEQDQDESLNRFREIKAWLNKGSS